MPYLITFTWYSPSQANKVAQRYLDTLKKLPVPPIIKRLVPAATASTKEGFEVVNVDEVKKEDLWEASDYLSKFMLEFRDIESVRYHIRQFATIAEGLKMIGLG
jgi:hypothetical protein